MGILNLFQRKNHWRLTSLDNGEKVEGEYVPTDVKEDIAATWAATGTLGREQPILQFDGRPADTMSFTARVWSKHEGVFGAMNDDIEAIVKKLRHLPMVDPDLGRPHVFELEIGESIVMQCVVASVGGISYDRLKPLTGKLRGATFTIALTRYVEYDPTAAENTAESLVRPLRPGETFELAAAAVYGEASLGEAIRRRNPKHLNPGEDIDIHFPPRHRLEPPLAPVCWALNRSGTGVATLHAERLRSRSKPRQTVVLGREWDGV